MPSPPLLSPHFSQSAHQNERGQHPDLSLKKGGSRLWWLTRGWTDRPWVTQGRSLSIFASTFSPMLVLWSEVDVHATFFGLALSVMECEATRRALEAKSYASLPSVCSKVYPELRRRKERPSYRESQRERWVLLFLAANANFDTMTMAAAAISNNNNGCNMSATRLAPDGNSTQCAVSKGKRKILLFYLD